MTWIGAERKLLDPASGGSEAGGPGSQPRRMVGTRAPGPLHFAVQASDPEPRSATSAPTPKRTWHIGTQQSFLIELAPKLGQAVHDIEIRQLNVDDVGVFRAIRLEALRLEPSAYASNSEDWASLSDEQWRDRLQVPVFVAFRAGEPVGIMGLLRQQPSKMKHRSTLIMVYLRASERGKGLARGLLESVVKFAAQNG